MNIAPESPLWLETGATGWETGPACKVRGGRAGHGARGPARSASAGLARPTSGRVARRQAQWHW